MWIWYNFCDSFLLSSCQFLRMISQKEKRIDR